MKRYEGLFILKASVQDERVKEILDLITQEIIAVGGKVETTQKMEKRPFARVADRKNTSGFYVNVIFEAPPSAVKKLPDRFKRNEDIFRIMFSKATTAAVAA